MTDGTIVALSLTGGAAVLLGYYFIAATGVGSKLYKIFSPNEKSIFLVLSSLSIVSFFYLFYWASFTDSLTSWSRDLYIGSVATYLLGASMWSVAAYKIVKFKQTPDSQIPALSITALGTVGVLNTSLMVPMDSPFKTAKDFVDYYKANPDKVARWANTGNASLHTLGGHAFLQANGIKAQTIPHKGGAKARLSIISKQVDYGFVGIQLLAGFDTKMRPLGALGNTRDPNYPDVPTVEEAGLPPMGIANPMMVWAKKDIPEDAAQKLIVAIKKVAESKGFKKLIKKLGLSAIYASPEESVKLLNDLGAQVTPVAKRVFNK